MMGLILAAGAVRAADDQAFFAILAETTSNRMVGMPAMPALPPGVTLPPQIAAQMAAMSGAPQRKLNIRLWTPSIAPDDATAYVTPPAGLKQGPRLDLDLYRPKPEEGTTTPGTPGTPGQPPMTDFTIKLYWGSSTTVRPGQPKVIRLSDMMPTDRQRAAAESAKARAAAGGSSYFYKAGWTTGYWPSQKQPGTIGPDASLQGTFGLNSTYSGNVTLDVGPDVDFLDAFNLSSPDLSQKPDLTQSIALRWARIQHMLGCYAMGMGMESGNTEILWSSSEVESFPFYEDYMQMADVRKLVDDTKFMPGDHTACDIPAGIFANCDKMFMMKMSGWGNGTARDGTQPLPRLQTKTSLSIIIPPKGMGGMGGRGR
jgi:hypothetical protein